MKNSTKTNLTNIKSNNRYYIDNCQIMDDWDKVKLMPLKRVKKCLELMNAGDDEAFTSLKTILMDEFRPAMECVGMSDADNYHARVGMILLWLGEHDNILSNYDVIVERAVAIDKDDNRIDDIEIFSMKKKDTQDHPLLMFDESKIDVIDKVMDGVYDTKEYIDPYKEAWLHFVKRVNKTN